MMHVHVLRSSGAQKVLSSTSRRCFASKYDKMKKARGSKGIPRAAAPPYIPEVTEDAVRPFKKLSKQIPKEQRNGPIGRNEILGPWWPKPSENTTETLSAPKPKQKPNWRDLPTPPTRGVSKVHWALPDIYEVGRVIPRSTGPEDLTGENGMPLWGDWGVPLEVRTPGPSICSM